MKQKKSPIIVAFMHIWTSSIVIPFFGLLAGYFIGKFLATSLDKNLLIIIKDIVKIIFFFIGVKYSLHYINKKIDVENPNKSFKYSIVIFTVLITAMLIIGSNGLDLIGILYNVVFFGIIFYIYFIFTRKYFQDLQNLDINHN